MTNQYRACVNKMSGRKCAANGSSPDDGPPPKKARYNSKNRNRYPRMIQLWKHLLGWYTPKWIMYTQYALHLSTDHKTCELLVSRTTLQAQAKLLFKKKSSRPYTPWMLMPRASVNLILLSLFLTSINLWRWGPVWAWREAWSGHGPGLQKWQGICKLHCRQATARFW